MAQITGLLERQKALTEIEKKIKSLNPLNVFLKTPNPSNEYSVSFDGTRASILCSSKETIDELVKAYKEKIVEEINTLAEQYSISLDEQDKMIMNELFVVSKGNKQTPKEQ